MRYADLGPDYYERRPDTRRQIAHHVGNLSDFGFEVTSAAAPNPNPPGQETPQRPDPHRPDRPRPAPMARVRCRTPS